MLYVILCTDADNAADLRTETRPVHIEYLEAQSDVIIMAGATLSDDGTATGSHFVINVADRAAAEAFAAADPFAKQGIFGETHITALRKGFWFPQNAESA